MNPQLGYALQIKVLSTALKKIVDNGNTVVVVEHDPSFIKEADYLIEMGPGSGNNGGKVVFEGKVKDISKVKDSDTYQLLYGAKEDVRLKQNSTSDNFGLKEAYANNLKGIDVTFISEQVIAVKGVSGSGKSSLIKMYCMNLG